MAIKYIIRALSSNLWWSITNRWA